jgi:hypothetical protein
MPVPAKQQVTRGLVPRCHVVPTIQPQRNRDQDCYLENPLVPPMVHIHATILQGEVAGLTLIVFSWLKCLARYLRPNYSVIPRSCGRTAWR